jgi:membrane associated rhomboid family serine protease
MNREERNAEKRLLFNALFVPAALSVLMILTFVFEKGMSFDFHQGGVFPRNPKFLYGIFTMLFVHDNVAHLSNNILSFLILGACLYYFYRQIASKILFLSCLLSGILLWCFGRNSWHIGASALIYALALFLFFSGLLRRHIPLAAISLFVIFLYGSMIWHVFPWSINDPVSWEGHLSGAISGILLAFAFRKSGPQPVEEIWEEEEEEDENVDENIEEANNGDDE